MKDLSRLFTLPAGILCLAVIPCAQAQELPWPYNLPRTLKYYPQDEPHIKRGLEVQERLKWQSPTAMRKMGDDPGEKFMMDYWEFDSMAAAQEQSHALPQPARYEGTNTYANASETCILLAPLAPHTDHERSRYFGLFGRSIVPRDFQCPSDTVSCSSIGSDLCCQAGATCVNTSDGVGCCPSGATCGDGVAGCDTGSGYTSCPDSENGGCCLPGAACLDTGCVFYGTQTVSVTISTSTPSPVQSSEAPGSTVIITTGITQTVSEQGTTITQTVTAPVTITAEPTCAEDYFSCPASLGGGCCPNGQGCATDENCPDLTTSAMATAAPPVRPTTSAPTTGSDPSVTVADTNVPESTQATAGACPPYYYMCQARYLGGCCRVDRNCDTTSCPPNPTSNFVTSGLTIGIGQAPTGQCMTSWQSCDATVGGGCCPPGYACGTNCVAVDGTQTAAKETPTSNSNAREVGLRSLFFSLTFALLFTMI